jgi:hypothetical protein
MQTTRRRLTSVVLVLLTLVGGLAVVTLTGEEPAAAAGCYGDWCSGRDPQAMGCAADAVTTAHARIPGTYSYLELRWSPSCKTNWARVPASWGTHYPWALKAVQRPTNYTQAGVVASSADYSWTRMIYSPQMCVYASWTGPPGSVGTACA